VGATTYKISELKGSYYFSAATSAIGILLTFTLILGAGYSLHSENYYGVAFVQSVVPMPILQASCVVAALAAFILTLCQEWKKMIASLIVFAVLTYFTSPAYLSQILF